MTEEEVARTLNALTDAFAEAVEKILETAAEMDRRTMKLVKIDERAAEEIIALRRRCDGLEFRLRELEGRPA